MQQVNEEPYSSDGKIEFSHNPFSMPQGGMDALLNKNPLDIYAYQYDLVCNGVELSSGAVRNHDVEIMKKAFEIAGYTEDDLKKIDEPLKGILIKRYMEHKKLKEVCQTWDVILDESGLYKFIMKELEKYYN